MLLQKASTNILNCDIHFTNTMFHMANLLKRCETFHLHKYRNVLPLPVVDIVVVFYVVSKYSLSLLLDSPFLLYIILCILGKLQSIITALIVKELFQQKSYINLLKMIQECLQKTRAPDKKVLHNFSLCEFCVVIQI